MKKIQPCLWFNDQAEEAAALYTSVFKNSRIGRVVRYGKAGGNASGRPPGSVMTVELELEGLSFLGLNGGPHFKLNPSISFFVGCSSEKEIDGLWEKLNRTERMELKKYPFAEKYGWCEDKFGVNWQLILAPRPQKISPALLFANQKYGKAEEAIQFYVAQFPSSEIGFMARDEKTNAVLHARFQIAGQDFVALDAPGKHDFDFSPGVSFIVNCETQKEIDEIWGKLSAVPAAEQCGWLCDRYGVSWQIVPEGWGKTMADADEPTRERLMSAVLKMKKFGLKAIEEACK